MISINKLSIIATLLSLSNKGAATKTASATTDMFREGDTCNVTSSDFFKLDFGGEYRVAGKTGCTFVEGGQVKEDCFCGIDYEDESTLSEWKWQCNGTVVFGPGEGKVCPDTVPVPKRVGLVEEQLAAFDPVECDTTINPTGQRGDPVCAYSDCDDGGSTSSICGCVNKTAYGLGDGVQWFCMHSTCSCSKEDVASTTDMETDGSNSSNTGSSDGYAASKKQDVLVVTIVFSMLAVSAIF